MEKVENATEQDIQFYKEVYNGECVPVEKAFEFVFPTDG